MLLDPTGHRQTEAAKLAQRTRGLDGATIGLLNSTKRNSDIFLKAVGDELVKHYGARELLEVTKPTFSLPLPANQQEELAKAHFIIAGVGD